MKASYLRETTTRSSLALLAATLACMHFATASTIFASSDSPGRQNLLTTSVIPTAADNSRLAVGGVNGSNDFFRSYLAFDLTGAQQATTVTLTLFDAGSNETNTTLNLLQTFTLFQLASNWNNVQPLPAGTNLATFSTTLTANPSGNATFTSAALTSAFNATVGGILYLGIYSPEAEAAPGIDAFQWFRGVNGSFALLGEAPTLTFTPVPEPSATLLGGLGLLCLLRRRR